MKDSIKLKKLDDNVQLKEEVNTSPENVKEEAEDEDVILNDKDLNNVAGGGIAYTRHPAGPQSRY